jgi:hypothetical protein
LKDWLTKLGGYKVFRSKLRILLSQILLIVGATFLAPNLGNAQHFPHIPGELLIAPKLGVSDLDLEDQYKAMVANKNPFTD